MITIPSTNRLLHMLTVASQKSFYLWKIPGIEEGRRDDCGARPLGRSPGRTIHQSKGSDELSDLGASAPESAQRFRSSTRGSHDPARILKEDQLSTSYQAAFYKEATLP
jgi:hypothetical protein